MRESLTQGPDFSNLFVYGNGKVFGLDAHRIKLGLALSERWKFLRKHVVKEEKSRVALVAERAKLADTADIEAHSLKIKLESVAKAACKGLNIKLIHIIKNNTDCLLFKHSEVADNWNKGATN